MLQEIHTARADAGSSEPHASLFYRDCIAALDGPGDAAAMVLDARGKVLFCNAAAADTVGFDGDELIGSYAGDFIPNLPFNPAAPGNNIAYAAYFGRRNQWRTYSVLDDQGNASKMDLLLDVVVVRLRYLILLWVRDSRKP